MQMNVHNAHKIALICSHPFHIINHVLNVQLVKNVNEKLCNIFTNTPTYAIHTG